MTRLPVAAKLCNADRSSSDARGSVGGRTGSIHDAAAPQRAITLPLSPDQASSGQP